MFHVEHSVSDTSGPAAVPNETGPQELGQIPAALAAAYPDAISGLTAYAELLATDGVVRGLIGPREVPRLWERHIANCALLERVVPQGSTVADVGSGAGLPGLVLALVRPDVHVTLIEPLLRRATFLSEAVEVLGLRERVTVVRARAEELSDSRGGRLKPGVENVPADVVTARAVAALPKLLTWCWPLVKPGGRLAVLKGESAAAEVADAAAELQARSINLADVKVETVEAAGSQATLIVIPRPDRQG